MLKFGMNVFAIQPEALPKDAFIQHIHDLRHLRITGPITMTQLQDQLIKSVEDNSGYVAAAKDWCGLQLRKVGDECPNGEISDIEVTWDTVVGNIDSEPDEVSVLHIDFFPLDD